MRRKSLVGFTLLCWMTFQASGTMVVHDIVQTAEQVIAYALSYSKQVAQYETELTTSLTQAESLIRQGNPQSLMSEIPGLSTVKQLAGTGAALMNDVNQWRALAYNLQNNPAAAAQIMASYGQTWNGATSSMGITSTPFGGTQFAVAQYQAVSNIQKMLNGVEQQKQALEEQISTVSAAMNGARDQATQQKYAAALTSLQSALQELNSREAELHQQLQMLQIQTGSAAQIYQNLQRTQASAAYQNSAEAALNAAFGTPGNTPGSFTTTGSEFGYIDNPALGGTGDPGTGGNWFTGAAGQQIGSATSQGISLPASTETQIWGSTSAAQNQPVVVTDLNTGLSSNTTIVDVGPGASAVARGIGVDLTHGTAQALQMTSGDRIQVTPTLSEGTVN